ncbi:MAG: trypsin-like peptidase domain-containing protein, partial [Reyranella sp.]|nr:trypsin-like peptidase domain-containing protein [Reyranella sp.]
WVGVRPYSDIKVGERALTIGTPQGLELTVAEGIVSSKRSQNDSKLIQTSAPISQGSSGGGLFDAQGELLGITTFYFKAGQNLNFAVAAEEFSRPEAPASAD